jgi:hypothetical protein
VQPYKVLQRKCSSHVLYCGEPPRLTFAPKPRDLLGQVAWLRIFTAKKSERTLSKGCSEILRLARSNDTDIST